MQQPGITNTVRSDRATPHLKVRPCERIRPSCPATMRMSWSDTRYRSTNQWGRRRTRPDSRAPKLMPLTAGGLGVGLALGSATPGVSTEAGLFMFGVLTTGAAGVGVTGEEGAGGGAKPILPYERVTPGRTGTLMVLRYIRMCGMSYTALHDRHVSTSSTGTGGRAARRGRSARASGFEITLRGKQDASFWHAQGLLTAVQVMGQCLPKQLGLQRAVSDSQTRLVARTSKYGMLYTADAQQPGSHSLLHEGRVEVPHGHHVLVGHLVAPGGGGGRRKNCRACKR